MTCEVREIPPATSLLDPAHVWGTPTWTPGVVAVVPANGTTTLTVTNPTTPIFGRVSVTKAITGATGGVTADATFSIVVDCGAGGLFTFDLGAESTDSTPDVPVGTSCTVTEDPPTGGLVDGSYTWVQPPPAAQIVTITSSGQVVPVTVTNTVVRVFGQLTITKATIATPGIVDSARTFATRTSVCTATTQRSTVW